MIDQGFLQTWLFCGFLQEFLAMFLRDLNLEETLYRHEDFIVFSQDDAQLLDVLSDANNTCVPPDSHLRQKIITTAKLEPLFARWTELVRPKLMHSKPQYVHLTSRVIPIAMEMLQWEKSKSLLSLSLQQNLRSVCQVVTDWFQHITSGVQFVRGEQVVPILEAIWSADQAERMQTLGWCPFEISKLKMKKFNLTLCHYLAKLDKRKDNSRKF